MAAKPKLFTLLPAHPTPALATADLVMAILKHTSCTSLDDLRKYMEAGDEAISAKLAVLILEESQMTLIEDEHEVAAIMRIGPTVSVAECSGCGKITAVEGTPPRACGVTLGCGGTLTKSTVAKKVPYIEPV